MVARTMLVLVLSLLVGTGTFVAGLLAAPIDLAVAPPPTSVLLLAADGRQFATLQPTQRYENVAAADIPQVMRDAIIAAEDERFLTHSGVDALSTIRAAFRDISGSGPKQGGSTLTQQYVKNAYVGNERTLLRKVREAALAVRLESRLSKQQILTDYLNALYLGNGVYGVQAASRYYYGVPVKDLDLDPRTKRRNPLLALARASMLAGIAPAPSAWNPVKDFATARVRQQYTLNRMVVVGSTTSQLASNAFGVNVKPLRLLADEAPTIAPEFADYVKARLRADPLFKDSKEDSYFRGGLRVKTTLDLDLQQAFNEALASVLPKGTDPQAAIVAVDYTTGDVKAMATLRRRPALLRPDGTVFKAAVNGYEQRLGYNLATAAERSVGSTIKPFTLAVALQQGMSLSTSRYGPAKDSIPNPGGFPNPYVYGNSDPSEAGRFSLRRAMAYSVNTIYLPLAKEVGRAKVAALAQAAGLQGTIKPGNLSFGIGAGVEVTPISQAIAYGTFANEGVRVTKSRAVTEIRSGASGTDEGTVLQTVAVAPRKRVMTADVAGDVVKAMTDVVTGGTATRARQKFTVFGKTGTTNDSTDAWFTACIPEQKLCISTWMGYDYSTCDVKDTSVKPALKLKVDGSCGGMKNLYGHKQVYGGTLPAIVFAKAQENLKRIKAERAARAAGKPLPTATPTPTKKPRPTATLAVTPSRRPSPTPSLTEQPMVPPSATPSPSPSPTEPGIIPSSGGP